MSVAIAVAPAVRRRIPPTTVRALARRLARAAHRLGVEPSGLSVRIVDDAEMEALHRDHMGLRGPTDVLSFPVPSPPGRTFEAGSRLCFSGLENSAAIFGGPSAPAVLRRFAPRSSREQTGCARVAQGAGFPRLLGDVVIDWDAAVRQATGRRVLDELTDLGVHGLVHLLGYDHEEGRAAARVMFRIERRACRGAGLPPPRRPYAGGGS